MPPLAYMIAAYLGAFAIAGLYREPLHRSGLDVLGRVTRGSALAVMLIVVGAFFFSRSLYSRSLIVSLLVTSILVLGLLRILMILVGPRPLPNGGVEAFLDDSSLRYWIDKREDVLPGVTGLWQIRGRSELSFKEMLTLDIHYIKNWSFGKDIEILARTLPVVMSGRGAY